MHFSFDVFVQVCTDLSFWFERSGLTSRSPSFVPQRFGRTHKTWPCVSLSLLADRVPSTLASLPFPEPARHAFQPGPSLLFHCLQVFASGFQVCVLTYSFGEALSFLSYSKVPYWHSYQEWNPGISKTIPS